ncbi:Poly-beta-1,6-N-acetyl-D-glucosamine synthase [Pandoraea pnomenusa]|uniref:Poly-beta-1,6-N-acetyl-D-glucosamine synthase n=1 Tax=Pandoraea pnomenusa TaxID=93220 RepID=A0A378YH49_9BURK|nr:Uncharacterised protein [Pandoraea pnomenusa]VVE67585.1 Poly-beta-1,6-N-acetyl-D-glucosamine synthase [Pandoraea pnomenusa]
MPFGLRSRCPIIAVFRRTRKASPDAIPAMVTVGWYCEWRRRWGVQVRRGILSGECGTSVSRDNSIPD